jgi:hypothetical protein
MYLLVGEYLGTGFPSSVSQLSPDSNEHLTVTLSRPKLVL